MDAAEFAKQHYHLDTNQLENVSISSAINFAEKYAIHYHNNQNSTASVNTNFYISLVYVRVIGNSIETALRTIITDNAENENEALGYAIKYFDEEMKDYCLKNKLVSHK